MTRFLLIIVMAAATCFESVAQKQSPSLIYKNHVISYNIVRYSPVWEIQEGGSTGSEALASSRLFRNVRANEATALRSFLFNDENEPADLRNLNGKDLLQDLSGRKVNIYYRIEYEGQQIYLATLNQHSSRSIIPFKDVNGRWDLDLEFMNDPFFECLQNNDFNPYTGEFTGRTLGSYGFEELESGVFHDHSGMNAHAPATNSSVVYGRIGSALLAKRSTSIVFPAEDYTSGRQVFVDFHLNASSTLATNEWKTILKSDNEGLKIELRMLDETTAELRASFHGKTSSELVAQIGSDKWYHVNVRLEDGTAKLKLDGLTKAVSSHSSIKVPASFIIGGPNGARFKLDELNFGI